MENKKELQIAVSFEEEKLEVMSYFMGEKGVTIEDAMQEHLNEIYEKYVPSAMRKYLNRNDAPEQSNSLKTRQDTTRGQENLASKKREERRQAKEQKQSGDPLPEVRAGESSEENSQEMSMSM